MAELIRKSTGGILEEREFWKLKNDFEVIASESDGKCYLFVSGTKNGQNIELVSKYLESQKFGHNLFSTIDSWGIEVPKESKIKAIELIEQWRW